MKKLLTFAFLLLAAVAESAAPTYKNFTAGTLDNEGDAVSPSDTSIGDMLIICVHTQGTASPSHTIQSGFDTIVSVQLNDGTTDAVYSCAVEIATAGGTQTYRPYSVTGGTAGQTSSSMIVVTAGTWANWPVTGGAAFLRKTSATSTGTGAANCPATGAAPATLYGDWLTICAAGYTSTSTGGCTQPANYTERIDGPTTPAHQCVATRAQTSLAGTNEDPAAWTDTITTANFIAFTIALPGTNVPVHQVANNETCVMPTGTLPQDIIFAMTWDFSAEATPSGWTEVANENTGSGVFQVFYRIWQSGDSMPSVTVSYAACVTYRYEHQSNPIVTSFEGTRVAGANVDIETLTNDVDDVGNSAHVYILGEGTGTFTPATNYIEGFDSGVDATFEVRTNLTANTTTGGTVVATSTGNSHSLYHVIMRQVDGDVDGGGPTCALSIALTGVGCR